MELMEARKSERYSQQQMADYLGVSRPTYAKMEAAPETVTVEDAKKIAAILGLTVNQIFFSDNDS